MEPGYKVLGWLRSSTIPREGMVHQLLWLWMAHESLSVAQCLPRNSTILSISLLGQALREL